MPQQCHIAYRVDTNTLLNQPELVLQRISMKIIEKRESVLENLVNKKVQFKTSSGIEQGTCIYVNSNICSIKVNEDVLKIPIKKLLI